MLGVTSDRPLEQPMLGPPWKRHKVDSQQPLSILSCPGAAARTPTIYDHSFAAPPYPIVQNTSLSLPPPPLSTPATRAHCQQPMIAPPVPRQPAVCQAPLAPHPNHPAPPQANLPQQPPPPVTFTTTPAPISMSTTVNAPRPLPTQPMSITLPKTQPRRMLPKAAATTIKELADRCFTAVATCRECPREILANSPLAKFHDACSCECDVQRSKDCTETRAFHLMPQRKRSRIYVNLGGATYSIPYSTLTPSTFRKANTKKFCVRNNFVSAVARHFFLPPGQPVRENKHGGDPEPDPNPQPSNTKVVAIKIAVAENADDDASLMYRITKNKDTRGIALVRGSSYRISVVYSGANPDMAVVKSQVSNSILASFVPLSTDGWVGNGLNPLAAALAPNPIMGLTPLLSPPSASQVLSAFASSTPTAHMPPLVRPPPPPVTVHSTTTPTCVHTLRSFAPVSPCYSSCSSGPPSPSSLPASPEPVAQAALSIKVPPKPVFNMAYPPTTSTGNDTRPPALEPYFFPPYQPPSPDPTEVTLSTEASDSLRSEATLSDCEYDMEDRRQRSVAHGLAATTPMASSMGSSMASRWAVKPEPLVTTPPAPPPPTLNPLGQSTEVVQQWLRYHNFDRSVQHALQAFTEADLCALDCTWLISPTDANRLCRLVSQELGGDSKDPGMCSTDPFLDLLDNL